MAATGGIMAMSKASRYCLVKDALEIGVVKQQP